MKNWALLATFFSLWLSTQLSEGFQDYLAYFFILTFGVLHGANDIVLLTKQNKNLRTLRALIPYILIVLAVTFLFFFYKSIVLALFIIVSGYHFGEQHFRGKLKESNWLQSIFFTFYGLTILFMIFYTSMNEVQKIIFDVTGYMINATYIELGLFINLIGFAVSFSYLIIRKVLRVQLAKELFMFLIFFIVFNVASLLWAFAIYFILWHSIPSLNDQMNILYGSSKPKFFINYLRSSWIYWSVSVLGLFLLYVVLQNQIDYFITAVLYVLAAITFPHVIVMSKLEKN